MLNQYIGQKNKDLAVSQSVNAVMATLLVVSIALMVYGFRSNRKIRQKNRVASALINELLTNKQQLLNRIEPYKNEDEKETIDTEQLHEKFLKMEKLIIDKKLIVRPKLDRSDVAKEMGMTTNDFNALFNRFSTLSFNNYINDLRMELAAKMLKDKQNYTIEAIATECGIPVRQTFHRLFAKKFGMTPAEYRNS
jgi:AraC-like DNA-binding protein